MSSPDYHDPETTMHEPYPDDLVRVLDDDGSLLSNAEPPALSDEALLDMYADIKLARHFDTRAVSIQRQGRIATYAPMTGQEGSQVATSHALDAQDWLIPTYRDHAAKYVRGVELASMLKTLRGYREGYRTPEGVNVLPEYVPIATQLPQAMGMAWGYQLQGKEDTAVLCHLGDGATSEGDFHEGLNFAGVFDVPVIFVCNNNQWAISTPRERQTTSATLAQKADAYGVEGVRVDGTDPLAVYAVTRAALAKAKAPVEGERRPTLIESVQYRHGAHTTADDPSKYRDERDGGVWRERDPLRRLGNYLSRRGVLDEQRDAEIGVWAENEVSAAIETAEAAETSPEVMVEHVHETVPDRLRDQMDELNALREKYGDDAFEGVSG